jgi:aconitate hydratase
LAERLIEAHLVEGRPEPGQEIGLRVDQTLTRDATGTMVMLEVEVRAFMAGEGREGDFVELAAEPDARYDHTDEIDLSTLEPLIARPRSPGDVVPVSEVAGTPMHQVVIGSSANPGLRDVAIVAAILADRTMHPQVSRPGCSCSG